MCFEDDASVCAVSAMENSAGWSSLFQSIHGLEMKEMDSLKQSAMLEEWKKDIEKVFNEQMSSRLGANAINSVQVRHNNHLQAATVNQFLSERNTIQKQGNSDTVRFLWHASGATELVMKNGFNQAYSNMEMNVYGVGSYFATTPLLSANYAWPDKTTNVRTIMLCMVLVGEFF